MPIIPTDTEVLKKNNQTDSTKNPLTEGDEKSTESATKIYSEEDKVYISFLQTRLESAKRQKMAPLPEWNGLNYYKDFENNVKLAHTFLPAKKNEDDVIVSAGTIEQKLDTLLSHINNLDLSAEVLAFDKENNMIGDLGTALTDAIFMTEQQDGGEPTGDEEKKILRQRELLAQNAVFVQEEWVRTFERKKKLSEKYDGQFKDWKNWSDALELVFEGPSRTLLYGPNVFLGDITKFYMKDQPFIFYAFQTHYDIAKTKYGKFENWKYVVAGAIPAGTTDNLKTIYDNKWRLMDVKENDVEVILYQDQPGDEFQVIINGVLMLPIGFPLSAVSPGGVYNIAKQVFRVINSEFAYGKPFIASGSIKEIAALIDEMIKLFVLKTRKSITPPYVNTSGRVISKRVLSPGRISMGIDPNALKMIGTEGQGVTSNEFSFLKELQDRVDKSTTSPNFSGQQTRSNTTATEIETMMKQAKETLGLAVAVCVLLEKKLAYLRLYNIIQNFFDPIDTKLVNIDGVQKYINMYRKTSRTASLEGDGMGTRQVVPFDTQNMGDMPNPKVIRRMEHMQEKQTGKPVRLFFLDPEALKVARLTFYIVINPKEKEGSALAKVQFREQLADVISLMQLGSMPNKDGLEQEFSRVWNTSRSKLFASAPAQPAAPVSPVSPAMAGASAAVKGGAPAKGRATAVPSVPVGGLGPMRNVAPGMGGTQG